MSGEPNFLDVTLLGKEYRVACPPGEREALQSAVDYVDGKMREIAGKTKSHIAERIAVMAALNITHELLSQKKTPAEGVDFGALQRRISAMETQLDAVLAPPEKLS